MSSVIANRISRLEKAVGSPNNELVEQRFSDETKDLLRGVMRTLGTMTPDEIEARLNERRWVPKSLLRPLSPEASKVFEQARLAILEEQARSASTRSLSDQGVPRA